MFGINHIFVGLGEVEELYVNNKGIIFNRDSVRDIQNKFIALLLHGTFLAMFS